MIIVDLCSNQIFSCFVLIVCRCNLTKSIYNLMKECYALCAYPPAVNVLYVFLCVFVFVCVSEFVCVCVLCV